MSKRPLWMIVWDTMWCVCLVCPAQLSFLLSASLKVSMSFLSFRKISSTSRIMQQLCSCLQLSQLQILFLAKKINCASLQASHSLTCKSNLFGLSMVANCWHLTFFLNYKKTKTGIHYFGLVHQFLQVVHGHLFLHASKKAQIIN